ncbi:MAG: SAM-dependent methyltransferase [Planctomycetota bacterium]
MNEPPSRQFVSRAGKKLAHALETFDLDVSGTTCADFGCNVGGFTDCLLQARAAMVYAIDTGYGTLAYTLRRDERVIVMERTNALHADPPELVDVVSVDLAWTPQRHALPAALRWLKPAGMVLTLVKPHYELSEDEKLTKLIDGRLDPNEAKAVLERVLEAMPDWGMRPEQWTRSPLTGGKSSRKAAKAGVVGSGNIEFMVLARPEADSTSA